MNIKKIIVGKNLNNFEINTYLIINNNKAIIIDPGDEWEKTKNIIEKEKLTPVSVILTHGHVDHIKDTKKISEYFNLPVYIHEAEKKTLSSGFNNLSVIFGIKIESFPIKEYLNDNQIIEFENEKLTIIHTPGHTPGGICISGSGFLISGDTLFKDSLGRTDIPGGNENQLINSIKEKLFNLKDETIVYPGHFDSTTIGTEKKNWSR